MKQSKILYTGFKKAHEKGISASEILLNETANKNTFLFTNDFDCIKEEVDELLKEEWDKIVMFGQKPAIKALRVERCAHLEERTWHSNWNLMVIANVLKDNSIDFKFSDKPGNSYCNYAYCQMLKGIHKKRCGKVVFIHVPYMKNFEQFDEVVNLINEGKLEKEVE